MAPMLENTILDWDRWGKYLNGIKNKKEIILTIIENLRKF